LWSKAITSSTLSISTRLPPFLPERLFIFGKLALAWGLNLYMTSLVSITAGLSLSVTAAIFLTMGLIILSIRQVTHEIQALA
jgi:hypothetical protein